ncbi:MAG: hypothetical protein LBS40_04215 [Burkholderiales bacterium]|jgi:hypothetical protein|nr:hypothetical protein [Burkholderiales bacterium]
MKLLLKGTMFIRITLLMIIAILMIGCTKNEEGRLRSYLPLRGDTYKFCTYTSKNQKERWENLKEDEIGTYETIATVLITSETFRPKEWIIEKRAFVHDGEMPFVSRTKLKLEKDRILIDDAIYPNEKSIILKSPIKLKNKWNSDGWEIDVLSGKRKTVKVKCEITSLNNETVLGKLVDTIEVSCDAKEKDFGKVKRKIARNFGIVQISMEDEGITWMKEELCPDQTMPQSQTEGDPIIEEIAP